MGKIWNSAISAAPARLWALAMGGVALTLFAAWLVQIIANQPWPADLAQQRLGILGFALYAVLTLIGVVMVSLAAVRMKGAAFGGTIEVDSDEDPTPALPTA